MLLLGLSAGGTRSGDGGAVIAALLAVASGIAARNGFLKKGYLMRLLLTGALNPLFFYRRSRRLSRKLRGDKDERG